MPNPVADETVHSMSELEMVISYLDSSMRWAGTSEGEAFWRDIRRRLSEIRDYARTHPEAVQGSERITERERGGAFVMTPIEMGRSGAFLGEYQSLGGYVYRWMGDEWERR